MSVSALLVLGDKVSGLIDDQIMEQWFSSYVGKATVVTISLDPRPPSWEGEGLVLTVCACIGFSV